VNSAGGDDVALEKSFIITCEGPVLNWYSLLPPHSVCTWVDLKTKFMQAFQMFHDTTASRKTESHCGTSWEDSCNSDPRSQKLMTRQRSMH
jgi:hypothetical protein